MSNRPVTTSLRALTVAAALGLAAAPLCAQELKSEAIDAVDAVDDAVEIERDVTELQALMRPHPDIDTINTVLAFQNPTGGVNHVRCAAFNHNGRVLGSVRVRIPPNGLRFILASDLSNGLDYIGSAQCGAKARVIPSAFVVGAGLTDAPVKPQHDWVGTRIRFPVIASY